MSQLLANPSKLEGSCSILRVEIVYHRDLEGRTRGDPVVKSSQILAYFSQNCKPGNCRQRVMVCLPSQQRF
jgi:hypothetical protein